jgi:hypothetical protein
VFARPSVEKEFGVRSGKWAEGSGRVGGAIDGVVDTRVAPNRPQDAVLYISRPSASPSIVISFLRHGPAENSSGEILMSLMLDKG